MVFPVNSKSRCMFCGKKITLLNTLMGSVQWFHDRDVPESYPTRYCATRLSDAQPINDVYLPSKDPLVQAVLNGV